MIPQNDARLQNNKSPTVDRCMAVNRRRNVAYADKKEAHLLVGLFRVA
jgi:hypothetical protein